MDESKDKELEEVGVSDSVVTVKTVVSSSITTTTTETVIKEVVSSSEVERVGVSEKVVVEEEEEEEEDGRGCEVGDVMVEVLGSEVFVDGVIGVGGEMGSHEFGRQEDADVDVGNVDGDGGRGVGESVECREGVLPTQEDVSALCEEGNVANLSKNQFVGCESNLANSGPEGSEACGIDKTKAEEVVVKEDIEMISCDVEMTKTEEVVIKEDTEMEAGRLENVGLCTNSYSDTIEGKCGDIENNVPVNEKIIVNEEESFGTVKTEDKGVNSASVILDARAREQHDQSEGDKHVVSEAVSHSCGAMLVDETINGGINSVEASTTSDKINCQEKVDIFESVSRGSENTDSILLDFPTQTNKVELMDDVNEDIRVPETEKQVNGKIIEEKLPFVRSEESIDAAVTGTVGHTALGESKLDGTDMEIDTVTGSIIYPENQQVDVHERGEDIENDVIVASFSEVPREETTSAGMDIDTADAHFDNKSFVREAVYDVLKSNNEILDSGAGILAKCNKSFDPIASAAGSKQHLSAEEETKNVVENPRIGSPVLDVDVPHVSDDGNFPSDLLSNSEQATKSTSEGHIDHSPKPDVSRIVEDVTRGPECDLCSNSEQATKSTSEGHTDHSPKPDESGFVEDVTRGPECGSIESCLENHASDGVANIGSNMKNLPEVQEAMLNEQVSTDHALSNEGDDAKLHEPVTLDADSVSVVVSNAKVDMEVLDKQAILLNASTDEDKTIDVSDPVIACKDDADGSHVEAVHKVEEAAVVTDQAVSMDKSAVNEETAMLSDYVTHEEETTKQPISMLHDTVDSLDEAYFVDEVGPFLMETEDLDESGAMRECLDVESGPTNDENWRSDGHVHEPQLPSDSPVKELEQEAADDDANADSDMQDTQDNQEAAGHDAKAYSDVDDAQDDQEAASSDEQSEEQDVDEEHVSGSAEPRNKTEKKFTEHPMAGNLLKDRRISYQLPPETQRAFSVADLVWGKVKSHPWWPGQIFHPSDSSEKAMKYFKNNCYLVAYFGDRTFAWNEASVLKPFRNHFSVAERQNKTEAFQNAVSCALEEVSRRTELGLACSCVPQETYDKIRYQMVENTGIKEGSSKRDGLVKCTGLDDFQPDKLAQYVRSLAVFPTANVDRFELVIAKAQLISFLRLKDVDSLAEFQYYEGISGEVEDENAATTTDSKASWKGSKRKHNLKDVVYQRRREKSMTELIGETMYYLDSEFDSHEEDENMWASPTSMKRKASGFGDFTSQPTTKTISVAKVSQAASSNPQQSFKVGECIRRVASQLTGSPSILKGSSDDSHSEHLADGADEVLEAPGGSPVEMSPSPSEESSLDEMLSQLHLCAQDPKKGYSFLGNIVSFFVEFRNMAVITQRQRLRKRPGGKRKSAATAVGTPETFEFEDRNDSYWKDMVVQNSAEAKPARRGRKRKDEQRPLDSEKPSQSQSKPRKSSRKQYFHGPLGSSAETPLEDEKQLSQLPAELMLSFSDVGSLPSEMNLNKMFRRFGALKESETEIDTQKSRARLVFKKRADAEVAYSSAAMFNIFGSTPVNYQLNSTPSVSFKTCPPALTDNQEKET